MADQVIHSSVMMDDGKNVWSVPVTFTIYDRPQRAKPLRHPSKDGPQCVGLEVHDVPKE